MFSSADFQLPAIKFTRFVFHHNSSPHRVQGRSNAPQVQYGVEPALVTALNGGRPSVGSGSRGVTPQVKDVDRAFPYLMAVKDFVHLGGLGKGSATGMRSLNRLEQFSSSYFFHVSGQTSGT